MPHEHHRFVDCIVNPQLCAPSGAGKARPDSNFIQLSKFNPRSAPSPGTFKGRAELRYTAEVTQFSVTHGRLRLHSRYGTPH